MPENSLCVVGPDPALNVSGGVATHLRILSKLDIFSRASFCDVGSLNGARRASWLEIVAGFKNLRRRSASARFVLTNASISAGSLLKVFLQLICLPKTTHRAVYVFFHGGNFEHLSALGRVAVFALRMLGGRVDTFYFLTEGQQKGFLKVVGDYPTGRYRNFSDSDTLLQPILHGDVCHLLYVGRITQAKGVFESLAALEVLLKEQPGRFRLTFVGDGDAVPELQARITPVLKDAVEFKGYLQGEELEREYRSADLVLLPSVHPEGFPYVFIEAMRAGAPMLATAVGALPELISPGENGYIVSQDEHSIATTIRSHVGKPERHAAMRDNCHRCFTETLGRSSAERFYQSLLLGQSS